MATRREELQLALAMSMFSCDIAFARLQGAIKDANRLVSYSQACEGKYRASCGDEYEAWLEALRVAQMDERLLMLYTRLDANIQKQCNKE